MNSDSLLTKIWPTHKNPTWLNQKRNQNMGKIKIRLGSSLFLTTRHDPTFCKSSWRGVETLEKAGRALFPYTGHIFGGDIVDSTNQKVEHTSTWSFFQGFEEQEKKLQTDKERKEDIGSLRHVRHGKGSVLEILGHQHGNEETSVQVNVWVSQILDLQNKDLRL